jgi:methionine-rich copper-binding protein CopC
MNKIQGLSRVGVLASIAMAFIVAAPPAGAHAKLVSTTPTADSTVSSPNMIEVHFSEAVEFKMSTLKLATAAGAAVSVMSMTDPKDPTTVSIMPNAPLKAGVYKATWSAVTGDGHKVEGTFNFTVK